MRKDPHTPALLAGTEAAQLLAESVEQQQELAERFRAEGRTVKAYTVGVNP